MSWENLFVYGTLRKGTGHPMAKFLAEHALFLSMARARGRLFDLGNYPGMLPPIADQDWVSGELYRLTDPNRVLQELDRYEGCSPLDPRPWYFERVEQIVRTEKGKIKAWLYYYCRPVSDNRRIWSGEYLQNNLETFNWKESLPENSC